MRSIGSGNEKPVSSHPNFACVKNILILCVKILNYKKKKKIEETIYATPNSVFRSNIVST